MVKQLNYSTHKLELNGIAGNIKSFLLKHLNFQLEGGG